jgi:Holliday junction DNA helicase RuvA
MSVQGVGAKASLAILGTLGPDGRGPGDRAGRLERGEGRAKGIGPKIAQRVVNELKDKAPEVMAMGAGRAAPEGSGAGDEAAIEAPAPAIAAPRLDHAQRAGRCAVGAGQSRLRPGRGRRGRRRGRGEAPEADTPALIRAR